MEKNLTEKIWEKVKEINDLKKTQKDIKQTLKKEFNQIHQSISDLNQTQKELIDEIDLIFITEIDYHRNI